MGTQKDLYEQIELKRERLRQKLIEQLGGDFPITNKRLHHTEEGKKLKVWFNKLLVQAHKKAIEDTEKRPKK